jgi:tetratricopeptide (TPR) repeat protein
MRVVAVWGRAAAAARSNLVRDQGASRAEGGLNAQVNRAGATLRLAAPVGGVALANNGFTLGAQQIRFRRRRRRSRLAAARALTMGLLFISHSSRDNDQAIRVRDWLKKEGWGEVFLDLDPSEGLAPGQRWQDELKRAGANCAAVIVLISPNWLASRWCQTEFLVADHLGKRIFPVFVAPTSFDELPLELKAKFQLTDISSPDRETEGFQRLAVGLKRAGLDPQSFEWPPAEQPDRAVYRGLEALDVADAAIFFGRDAAITRGLDELRRLRDGAAQRMLVVLGSSGAGKSSFLRAGLIARLKRDEENFLVLPVVRPERAALSGAQGLATGVSTALGRTVTLQSPEDLARAFHDLRRPIIDRLQRNARAARESYDAKPPTIILPIDQAEELFSSDNAECSRFCGLLTDALMQDGNVLILATIRSDAYEKLQNGLLPDRQASMSLPAIAAGSFQQIIEGPARLAKPPLTLEPALTQQLLSDIQTADGLPLLAFTLERLQSRFGRDGELTFADYNDDSKLGGIKGAIQSAVDAVLGPAPDKAQLALARQLFVPSLVQVDEGGVRRRIVRRADLTADAQMLADRFIAQRLLTSNAGNIEVAHETILRQWPALAGWIAEDRGALIVLDGVRAAAQDWRRHHSGEAWLIHRGERFRDAQKVAERPDFAASVDADMRAYMSACRKRERRGALNRFAVRATLTAAAFALVALTGVAGRAAYVARQNEAEAQRQYAAAEASADFLVSTFEVANPIAQNPDEITARTILDQGAARVNAEFSGQPAVRARLIDAMARAYSHLGFNDRAAALIEPELPALRNLGADGAPAMLSLARAYRLDSQLDRALETANEAKSQLQRRGATARPEIWADAYETLALIENDRGDLDQAVRDYDAALLRYRSAPRVNNMSIARVLNNQGRAVSDLGEYARAEQLLLEANALIERDGGPTTLFFGQNLVALAQNAYNASDYQAAQRYVTRARPILTAILGANHSTLADVLVLDGQISTELADYGAADVALTQAISIYSRDRSPVNLPLGIAQYSLADSYSRQQNYANAVAMFEAAEMQFNRGLGADHPNVGALLVQKAVVLRNLRRGAEATAACESGLTIIGNALGEESPMYRDARPQCLSSVQEQ